MKETPIVQIIHLCRKIDEIACDVYAKLADLCDEPDHLLNKNDTVRCAAQQKIGS